MAGSALGFAVALGIHFLPQGSSVGAVLLNMAVFGAVLAYVLQMASFIVLRLRFPELVSAVPQSAGASRGRRSAAAVAIVTLVTLFLPVPITTRA